MKRLNLKLHFVVQKIVHKLLLNTILTKKHMASKAHSVVLLKSAVHILFRIQSKIYKFKLCT